MTTTTRTAALGVFAALILAIGTKTIDVELAAGADWPMSDYISRNRPAVGDVVRICVAPVPGEAVPDHANNCASATVERN